MLGFFGPLSLILLLVLWALWLIAGFAMLQWAFGPGVVSADNQKPDFLLDLYASSTTLTTLGLGDMHPVTPAAKFLMALEGGTGFGFLAMVIGYLPVVYQAFSRRETNISLLDARAGSPPSAVELLRRYAESQALQELDQLLHEWEHWAAELLESHISYPVLTLFRSQHVNESWVSSLTAILDTCSLLIAGVPGIPARQAQLTFAMARHAAVDLSQVLATPPLPPPDRLPAEDLSRLRSILDAYDVPVSVDAAAKAKLAELRAMYEPYVNALADYLVLELPSWFPRAGVPDNWQTSAWERAARRIPPPEAEVPDEHL